MKICLTNDLATIFLSYANNSFKYNGTSVSGTIYAFIRNFRFNIINAVDSLKLKEGYTINLKVEFYFQKDICYHPLYRFDSTGSGQIDFPEKTEEIIGSWINASFRKISEVATYDLQKRSCLSHKQIDSFNAISEKHPIVNTDVYNKGIFMTLEEFRQNKPSISEYTLTRSKYYDLLYIKDKNKKDSAITGVFGFSDGKKIFIRYNSSYFTLFKAGNGFEFFGYENIASNFSYYKSIQDLHNPLSPLIDLSRRGIPGLFGSPGKRSTPQVWHFLDIETGKIY